MGSDSSFVGTNHARTETGSADTDDRNRADAETGTGTGTEPASEPRTGAKSGIEPASGVDDRARTRSKQQGDTPDSHTYACPLCGFTDDRWDTVYDHLLCSHRKRAISSALLEAGSSRE